MRTAGKIGEGIDKKRGVAEGRYKAAWKTIGFPCSFIPTFGNRKNGLDIYRLGIYSVVINKKA